MERYRIYDAVNIEDGFKKLSILNKTEGKPIATIDMPKHEKSIKALIKIRFNGSIIYYLNIDYI